MKSFVNDSFRLQDIFYVSTLLDRSILHFEPLLSERVRVKILIPILVARVPKTNRR